MYRYAIPPVSLLSSLLTYSTRHEEWLKWYPMEATLSLEGIILSFNVLMALAQSTTSLQGIFIFFQVTLFMSSILNLHSPNDSIQLSASLLLPSDLSYPPLPLPLPLPHPSHRTAKRDDNGWIASISSTNNYTYYSAEWNGKYMREWRTT